jgi:hypothetical protein
MVRFLFYDTVFLVVEHCGIHVIDIVCIFPLYLLCGPETSWCMMTRLNQRKDNESFFFEPFFFIPHSPFHLYSAVYLYFLSASIILPYLLRCLYHLAEAPTSQGTICTSQSLPSRGKVVLFLNLIKDGTVPWRDVWRSKYIATPFSTPALNNSE